MRRFFVLVAKELRELLTWQTILPLVVIVAMFGLLGNFLGEQADEQAEQVETVIVFDLDESPASKSMINAIESVGYSVEHVEATSAETAGEEMQAALEDANASLGIVVSDGFAEGIETGEQQSIDTYAVVRNLSITAGIGTETLNAVIRAVNDSMSTEVIASVLPDADPEAVKRPVTSNEYVIIGANTAQTSVNEVIGFIMSQTTFIPMVVFAVIIFSAQMIATAIASEKENKTLETMLSMPISRTALVTAKMLAASLVALLSAAVYMIGMRSYMNGIMSMEEGLVTSATDAFAKLGLTLSTSDYLLLGLTLFFAILVALGMAIILGAFAENVKSAQTLLLPMMMLVILPFFMTMFIDLEQASPALRWAVFAIPFSHPLIAAPNLFLGNYAAVWAGIAYEALWFAVLVFIAARIFSSDRILTMKLSLKRKK